MNICQMCANRIPTGNGDNFKCNKKCDEYLEFVALPIYGAAPDMYEALKMVGDYLETDAKTFAHDHDDMLQIIYNVIATAEGGQD